MTEDIISVKDALRTYNFINNDLSEGLNYGVSKENYNKCMEAISSDLRIKESTKAKRFCTDFYEEYKKLQSGTLKEVRKDG